MAKKSFDLILRAILLASVGALLGFGVANAAVVRLSFDPAFGDDFPDLSFSGQGELDVGESCFSSTGQIHANGAGDSCAVSFITASVDLFETSNPSNAETISFDPPYSPDPNPINSVVIDNLIVVGNMVVGLDTGIFGPRIAGELDPSPIFLFSFASSPLNPVTPVFPGGNVWLGFTANYSQPPFGDTFTVRPEAFIWIGDNCATSPGNCLMSNPAAVTFSLVSAQIPEPGSISLLLAALGGLAIMFRRGKNAPSTRKR